MLNTNIRFKSILIKLLGRKLIVYKNILKPRINKDIYQLVQSKTTKTLLWQLSVIYPLGTRRVIYLIVHYIILFRNLACIYKLLPIVYGDLFFITPILYFILSVLALLFYQVLLVSLLGIVSSIDSYSIIINLTQLFQISTKNGLGNIVVKNIKETLLLRLRLLKSLKACNRNYLKIKKLTLI